VQTVLTLSDGATVTSGTNIIGVGNINGGASATVSWMVTFQRKGTCTVQVRASGYDSYDYACEVTSEASVNVGDIPPSAIPLEIFSVVVISLTILLIVLVIVRRRTGAKNKRPQLELRDRREL
jgi:hypothetical protein